jgi:hypothetical protein
MPSRRSATTIRHVAPDPTGGKRALVLCGGGITGLTYAIGALRALDDLLVGSSVNDFDIYVGTSAGSMYLRRILPKHGIHLSRRNIERKPVQVPLESYRMPNLLGRLMRQTVFARRPSLSIVDDEDEAV